jgi:hypothetical protein
MSIPCFGRNAFVQLLSEHQALIRLTNELELQLYRLREEPSAQRVTECQQAGGALIGRLRSLLFRHDQEVLPLLEASCGSGER